MKNSLSRQELNASLFVLTGDAGGPKTSAGCYGTLIRYHAHRIAPVEKPPPFMLGCPNKSQKHRNQGQTDDSSAITPIFSSWSCGKKIFQVTNNYNQVHDTPAGEFSAPGSTRSEFVCIVWGDLRRPKNEKLTEPAKAPCITLRAHRRCRRAQDFRWLLRSAHQVPCSSYSTC